MREYIRHYPGHSVSYRLYRVDDHYKMFVDTEFDGDAEVRSEEFALTEREYRDIVDSLTSDY